MRMHAQTSVVGISPPPVRTSAGIALAAMALDLAALVRAYVASGSMRNRTNESSVFSGLIRRESVLAGLHEINDGRGIAALPRSLGVFPWFV